MADMRGLEAHHIGAQVGEAEPQRHLALEHAALTAVVAAPAFAGDDEHKARAVALGAAQEADERRMCLALRLAVQVEAVVDCLRTARQALLEAAVERFER